MDATEAAGFWARLMSLQIAMTTVLTRNHSPFLWGQYPGTALLEDSTLREMIADVIRHQGDLTVVGKRFGIIWEQVVAYLIVILKKNDDPNDVILGQRSSLEVHPDIKTRIDPDYARKWVKEQEKKRSEQAIVAEEFRIRILIAETPLAGPRELALSFTCDALRLGYSRERAALAVAKLAAKKLAQREREALENSQIDNFITRDPPNYNAIYHQMLGWMLEFYDQNGQCLAPPGPMMQPWWMTFKKTFEDKATHVLSFLDWLHHPDPDVGTESFYAPGWWN